MSADITHSAIAACVSPSLIIPKSKWGITGNPPSSPCQGEGEEQLEKISRPYIVAMTM